MNKLNRSLLIFALFLCGILLSCSHPNNTNKEISSELAEENENENRGNALPDTTAIIELMEYYQDIDTVETGKRFETYRMLVESRDNYKQEDIDWFFQNISHIDSVSKQAIILTRQEKYENLAYLLDSELGNYYSHPNSDTYSIYELSWAMLPLYRMISPDSKTYYEKLIGMWEMNRLMMEAVQIQSGERHPYYERMMHELSHMYDKVGDVEKKNEVDSIISNLY